jgi:Ni,Fe-hydrogenase I large subunit
MVSGNGTKIKLSEHPVYWDSSHRPYDESFLGESRGHHVYKESSAIDRPTSGETEPGLLMYRNTTFAAGRCNE